MPQQDLKPPGHLSIVLPSLLFGLILALITYVLLLWPAYYYVGLFLAIYFAKRIHELFGAKKDKEDAIFIKGQTKASVCIVGAGFSGLCMGIKLKKAGISFRILEKGSKIGGTWFANQYPGCRCDVWSILYQVPKIIVRFVPLVIDHNPGYKS